ncbi:MAG: UPF0158 family protein [Verrucomicrobiota bacterium]
MKKLVIKIDELESAFEACASLLDSEFAEEIEDVYLNKKTGEIVWVEREEEFYDEGKEGDEEVDIDACNEDLIELPADLWKEQDYQVMESFVGELEDLDLQRQLEKSVRGAGAFRRFKDIVFKPGNLSLLRDWNWHQTKCQRKAIVEWLQQNGIEAQWDQDIFSPSNYPDKRQDLLRGVLRFVRDVSQIDGVHRISMLGSLTTEKPLPKDVDLLVQVADDMPLEPLAKYSRQLNAKAMQTGDGCCADIFICDSANHYIGRMCLWKECREGLRRGCKAQHCGRRQYLSDDFQLVTLDQALVKSPPIDLWPEVITRVDVPEDVCREVMAKLS